MQSNLNTHLACGLRSNAMGLWPMAQIGFVMDWTRPRPRDGEGARPPTQDDGRGGHERAQAKQGIPVWLCESERGMAIMEVGAPLQKMLRPPVAAARSGGTRAGTRESSRRTPTELGKSEAR